MAGEVIQNPTLGSSTPFNVINPSGMSADQSIGNMTQVRGQNVQRGIANDQMAQQQQAMQMQQQQSAAELALKDRQLRDENYHRDRTEKLSLLYKNSEDEELALNEELQNAILTNNHELADKIMPRKRELLLKKSQYGTQLQNLETLKVFNDGFWNKDMKNADGYNLGAGMTSAMMNQKYAHEQVGEQLNRSLGDWVSSFVGGGSALPGVSPPIDGAAPEQPSQPESFQAGLGVGGSSQNTKERTWGLTPKGKEVATETGSAMKRGWEFLNEDPWSPKGISTAVSKKLSGDTSGPSGGAGQSEEAAMLNSGAGQSTENTQIGAVGKYQGLVEEIAIVAHGKMDPKDVQAKLNNIFDSLEKAVTSPDMGVRQAESKNAADAYRALKKDGVNTDLLDKAFYMLDARTRDHGEAAAVGAQHDLQKAANGEKVGVDSGTVARQVSKQGRVLHAMVRLMGTQADQVEDPAAPGKMIPRKLLAGFDESPFFDYASGKPSEKMNTVIMDIMRTISGAKDPEGLMTLLTDGDPSNDPKGFEFLQKLDPQMRDVLMNEVAKGSSIYSQFRQTHGLTHGENPGQIADVKNQFATAEDEYKNLEDTQLLGAGTKNIAAQKTAGSKRAAVRSRTNKQAEQIMNQHPSDVLFGQ